MILRYSLLLLTFGSIILQKTSGSNIRGIPGVDYPNFNEIPPTSFRCPEQVQKGFYPDFETGCQVFHYCEDGNKESFICPIGSTFNPLIKSCDRWFNSECVSPVEYDLDSGYENRRDYVAGGVASEYQLSSSNSLFDKMASLYEERQSESEKSQGVGYSEYGNSHISSQYDTMGENDESRREISDISQGSTHLDSIPNKRQHDRPFDYDEKVQDRESDASEDSGYMEHTQQYGEDVRVDDHGNRSGLDAMYYENPTIYNYHNRPNDDGNWEGESVFYEGGSDFDQEDLSYAHEKDTDLEKGDEGFDKSKSLQKRISEYRKRPQPKPVVSLVESDLEIVTLPPLRSKRPRIYLVPKDAEDKTTELSTDVSIESGNTEVSDAASASGDVIGGDESRLSNEFQQERSEDERDFGDWLPEESSGDAEDFLQESDDPESFEYLPEFENLDTENDFRQNEVEGSYISDSNVKELHNAMRSNVLYVDSASDNMNEKVSSQDQADDESGDEYYRNDGMGNYKNEESDMDERVQTEEYNNADEDDDSGNKIEDSSEVLKSYQYGVNVENDNDGYEEENEYSEDQGEMFQTLVDGKLKSFIRIGEDIIDPTEYFPEWNEVSSAEMEEISKRLEESNEKYLLENSNRASYQSGVSHDEESLNLGQIMKTTPEALEGYFADYPSDSSYQGEKDSDHAGTVTEQVTFISNSEDTFPTTQAYSELDSDGLYVYDGSEDPDTMESIYSTDDVGFIDDQSYTHPDYFEHTILEEQDATNADQPSDMPSNDEIYYYTTDMGSQFVTDQPDMEIGTIPMLNEEFSENARIRGDSGYAYQTSQDDASEVEFQEEYFTTDSDISDIGAQFVTDPSDFGTSSTAMLDEEYSKDVNIQRGFEYPHGEASHSDGSQSGEEFQEQYFQTDSDGSDLGTLYVTEQPEMSTTAMVDEEKYSDIHEESGFAYEASQSKGSDSDLEFQEYFKSGSDFSEMNADSANEKETPKDEVKRDPELSDSDESEQKSDALSDTLSNVSDTKQTLGLSKNMDSDFGESISSDKHPKFSETTEKSQSKKTSFDSLDITNLPNFGFDSGDRFAGQIGLKTNHESFKETSHSSSDKTNGRGSKSACSTCSSFTSEKEPKSFSNHEFGVLDGHESRHSSRTGKLLHDSKLSKLASFLKKIIAAKKKAKINMVKKILPSTEWDFERKISE